jgi:hypothetical protein
MTVHPSATEDVGKLVHVVRRIRPGETCPNGKRFKAADPGAAPFWLVESLGRAFLRGTVAAMPVSHRHLRRIDDPDQTLTAPAAALEITS